MLAARLLVVALPDDDEAAVVAHGEARVALAVGGEGVDLRLAAERRSAGVEAP